MKTLDSNAVSWVDSFFFIENLFYKNVEAEINQNFKSVLRTFFD